MGLLVVFLIFFLYQLSFSSSIFLCPKHQSISPVKFKETFTINPHASSRCYFRGQKPYPKTSSWNMSRDCCLWDGVICDDMTGHVIELDLGCSRLVGTIDSNSSLFQLSHLQRLNLSWNEFHGSHISPEFGRFSSLTHLDLYNSNFSGSECSVTDDIQSLVAHLKDDHKFDMHEGCTFNHRYIKSNPQDVENATWMLTCEFSLSSPVPFFLSLDSKLTHSSLHNLMVLYTDCLQPFIMIELHNFINHIPFTNSRVKADIKLSNMV
ncbi:receptor-like protein Cf-9 [Solanum pennellii]|uniref:Receptor-like protein Cf-9 n=1 Tax=Solanum pennellii TaxID=28526 RepID=A0ABM1V1M7_SOLPN|nr:receptor-like protein Cf-9 [Solanum pennellii]